MIKQFKHSAVSKHILTAFVANMLVLACVCNATADYSGVYKDNYQIIPNTMASLCKISADDIVEDSFKLRDCIDSLIIKRRSSDTETAKEGLRELNMIKADEISEMMSLAVIRGAEIADYYTETSKKTDQDNADAKTVNDIDGAAINTNQLLASVINSFRDIYVEQLKYLAISNIENIDKSILDDIAASRRDNEQEDNKNNKQEDNNQNENATAEVTTNEVKEVVTEQPQDAAEEENKDDLNSRVQADIDAALKQGMPLDADGNPKYAEYMDENFVNAHSDQYYYEIIGGREVIINKKTGKPVPNRFSTAVSGNQLIVYDAETKKSKTYE